MISHTQVLMVRILFTICILTMIAATVLLAIHGGVIGATVSLAFIVIVAFAYIWVKRGGY